MALSPSLEPSPLDLGMAFAFCRETLHMKQREVAAKSGIEPSYISRLENGKINPTSKTQGRVAGALGIDYSKIRAVAEVYAEGRRRIKG